MLGRDPSKELTLNQRTEQGQKADKGPEGTRIPKEGPTSQHVQRVAQCGNKHSASEQGSNIASHGAMEPLVYTSDFR